MNALAGLISPAAIGQQVQQSFQAGQHRRRETDTRDALASLVTDPMNEEAMGVLAQNNPQAAMQMQDRSRSIQAEQQKAQQEQKERDLTARALQGDDQALNELASVSFDRWKSVDANQKAAAVQESQILANAALDVLKLPPAQRGQRMMQIAQQMPEFAQQIGHVAQLPPDQQEAALRSAVFEGKMVGRLHEMERPRYQAIPEGGTLVDTKNPQAVREFQGQEQITEGRVIRNPQTGERMILENGQWVPIDDQGNRLVSDTQIQAMGGV